jgi:hypothetical protein
VDLDVREAWVRAGGEKHGRHVGLAMEADRDLRLAIADPILEHLRVEEALLSVGFG